MTRKRFIKFVMACGVQKRKAQKLALSYHAENFSYEDAFSCFCVGRFKLATFKITLSFHKATEATSKLAKAFRELGEEMREAVGKVNDNLTECLNWRAEDEKAKAD